MSQTTLSRDLALAIGLAAKALPDTQPKQLVQTLIEFFGWPLTERKLQEMTLKQYTRLLSERFERSYTSSALKQSLNMLQNPPQAKPETMPVYQSDDLPQSIRVAVTTTNGVQVDNPFNSCRAFFIYQVSGTERRLIDQRNAETTPSLKSESKQQYRAELISDCQVLYTLSIGGPATAKVVKQGIHPIKISTPVFIDAILEQLQYVLHTSPPPWLAKKMGVEWDSGLAICKESIS